jgi:hypothetical protein
VTLERTGAAITVSPGDQGGPMINGAIHTGEIVNGDLDVWTFDAIAGDRLAIHIGNIVDNDDFRPWIRVWGPNGQNLGDVAGVESTALSGIVAPVTGTYHLLVATFDSGFDGTGTYRVTMERTGAAITVSPGDQGGPMVNGAIHTGEIVNGDLDVWTFDATAGDRIAVHIGEIVDNDDFRPWIRVWGPNGQNLGDVAGVESTALSGIVAPVTGTYHLLVATFDSGFDGTGTYRMTMTRTGAAITVSAGDDGGPLLNGAIHTGEIVQGDVDVWTFQATAGDRIGVHIGEILDTDDFRPWIRVWGPNGQNLGDVAGVEATALSGIIAPVTGEYQLLVATFDSGFDGEGTYRFTITHTPGPITVSPGDQGGALGNGSTHAGEILQGDVDVWTIFVAAGERISASLAQTSETDDFRPWLRIWGPNGANVVDVAGVDSTAISNVPVGVSGTYLVLVSSFDSGFNGTGTYQVSVAHAPLP